MPLLNRIWRGDTVYQEPVCFSEQSRIPFLHRSAYIRPYTGQTETAWLRLPGRLNPIC